MVQRAVSGAEAALVTAAGLSRSTWLWGGALASAVLTAAAAAYEQPARLENDALEPGKLMKTFVLSVPRTYAVCNSSMQCPPATRRQVLDLGRSRGYSCILVAA